MNMFRESIINEASFSVKDLEKVAETYGKLFGKEFGGTFVPFSIEWYKKSKESGQGVRMINEMGRRLRINFSNRTSNFANAPRDFVVLSSIDFWEQGNDDDACPTTSCYFARAVNVVKIWKKLGQLIRTGKAGKYKVSDFANDVRESVNEASVADARRDFLAKHGGAEWRANMKPKFDAWVQTSGLTDAWNEFIAEIEPGKPEQNAFASKVKKCEKELEEHEWADPDTIFEEIEAYTDLVIEGVTRSFILCGMGGVGKTFHVDKKLKEILGAGNEGKTWYKTTGKSFTASSFYDEVFKARNMIYMCDEADDCFKDKEIITMLKPLLDTSGENTMEYSMGKMPCFGMKKEAIEEYCDNVDKLIQWGLPAYNGRKGPSFIVQTEKGPRREPWNRDMFNIRMDTGELDAEGIEGYWTPSKFFFRGGIIFISNMDGKDIDQAILSRSIFVDLWLTATDIARRIKDILHKKYPDDYDFVEEVIDYLSDPSRGKQLTIRSGVIAMDIIKTSARHSHEWKRLVKRV